ncbi:hypothetical protein [Streptomyces wuyuanensis]|uniref:hypothetical protein n=1 Tax=Streptomyces wuyuanensis TaxID=1196353 RepID=UPI00341B5D17
MQKAVPAEVLRKAIVAELVEFSEHAPARLSALCRRVGLESPAGVYPEDGLDEYTWACTDAVENTQDLINLAQRVVTQVGSEALDKMLRTLGVRGRNGEFQNLIFAGVGEKPKIVLTDATENRIKLTTNAHLWLVYDRPLLSSGLSWQALIDWWREERPDITAGLNDLKVGFQLRMRLARSLPQESPPQKLFFDAYYERVGRLHPEAGFEQPALLPEVHLHYDPYSQKDPANPKDLERQRMDFLMLLPNGERIVIEVDGVQHYSEKHELAGRERNIASPKVYGAMMAADRDLNLDGYRLFRFGGAELRKERPEEAKAMVNAFLDRLLPAPK